MARKKTYVVCAQCKRVVDDGQAQCPNCGATETVEEKR